MAYRSLEKLINLYDGYRRIVYHEGRQLLLLQESGTPYLVDRHCPHAGQVLEDAQVEAGFLICPKHLLQFSIRDGQPRSGVCGSLGVYILVYEGNTVGIEE